MLLFPTLTSVATKTENILLFIHISHESHRGATLPHIKKSFSFSSFAWANSSWALKVFRHRILLFVFSSFCFSFTFLSAHLTFAHTQTWDYTTTRDGSSSKRCGKLTLLTDMCIWNLISHQARLRNKMLSSSAASCFFFLCGNFCLAKNTSTREECTVRWVRKRKSCFKFQISHSNKKKTEKWEWLMSHLKLQRNSTIAMLDERQTTKEWETLHMSSASYFCASYLIAWSRIIFSWIQITPVWCM